MRKLKIFLILLACLPALAINCDAPSEDIDDILNCAKSDILNINPKARVYTQTNLVKNSPDELDFYDSLMLEYSQIFLKIKADIALKSAADYIVSELKKSKIDIKEPCISDFFTQEIERQKRINEARTENGFLDHLLAKLFGASDFVLSQAQEQKIKTRTREIIDSAGFKDAMKKTARAELAGLIPYENYVLQSRANSSVIGVVAYTSNRSRELADALSHGLSQISAVAHCKSLSEAIKQEASKPDKLNKFGLKFFYNEECQPAIVSYGLNAYTESSQISELASFLISKQLAIKALKDFVSSSVYIYDHAEEFAAQISKAYEILLGTKRYASSDGVKRENSYEVLENFFKNSSDITLIGTQIAHKWKNTFANRSLTGMILYYTPLLHPVLK